MGDDHSSGPVFAQAVDARRHGAVQPSPRLPEDARAKAVSPRRDLVVVAHDGHGQRRGDGNHVGGHAAGEIVAFGFGEHRGQAQLGSRERLDGDEDLDGGIGRSARH